jgi:hypothetical protein
MEEQDSLPNRFYRHFRMTSRARDILPIAFLLILWWIGVWGFVDTLITMITQNNALKALFAYGTLVILVIIIVSTRPGLLEHFV